MLFICMMMTLFCSVSVADFVLLCFSCWLCFALFQLLTLFCFVSVQDAVITPHTLNFMNKLVSTFGVGIENVSSVSSTYSSAASESLARRAQATAQDPVFQKMKSQFTTDFDFKWVGRCCCYWFIGGTHGSVGSVVRPHPQPSCLTKIWTLGICVNSSAKCLPDMPCLRPPFTSTILYHLQWPWPWLGITRSAQNQTCRFHFLCTLFNWSGLNLMCWSNWAWTFWYYFWVRFMESRENDCCCTELCSRSPVWMTWTIIHGHWRMGKPQFMQSFCCKVVHRGLLVSWLISRH